MEFTPHEVSFRQPARATAELATLQPLIPEPLAPRFRAWLAGSPDADAVLHYLLRLATERREDFERVVASPVSARLLITVFGHSQFLSEELLQSPDWILTLAGSGELDRSLSAAEFAERLDAALPPGEPSIPPAVDLARFRRRQILRILLRDVLEMCTLAETTEELSGLADAIMDVACRRIRAALEKRYGKPRLAEPPEAECGFSVLALGKWGGRELNYSSDIDLMFVYTGSGETEGGGSISNREFFKKLANQLTDLLSTYTREGLCYRVDLRLRPEGRLGEVCVPLRSAQAYYQGRARDWELQMLIKARVAAGDFAPGRELMESVEPLIYNSTLDFSAVESVSATRLRLHEKLAGKSGGESGLNVKLTPGGIRDIEFLVQCLQRLHGGREPWVQHAGTLLALSRLRQKSLLSDVEYSRLASAYTFLRNLEHRLQFNEDRQVHTLPSDAAACELIARRMPPDEVGGETGVESLLRQLNRHLENVQEIYERVIHAQQPVYYSLNPGADSGREPRIEEVSPKVLNPAPSSLVRFLDQKAPGLAATMRETNLKRGAQMFEHFLERLVALPELLGWLDEDKKLAGYVLDLFEHSPHFAEHLIRRPEHLDAVRRLCLENQPAADYAGMVSQLGDAAAVRRFYAREMLHIQSESICLHKPIFETLRQTSGLADAVIAALYPMAVQMTAGSHPPLGADYRPERQLTVIALGRLGMQEFDLGSDADLVFVLPDSESAELRFWTRVAERLIQLITAYTGEGVLFAVDTRLRANGREGPLVQLEITYKEYFTSSAQAWEGITYMKSRAVAGDIARGTEFLSDLQDLDWRRYGQSGRSKKLLWDMRMRLEKEQGEGNPLKAGPGGYYDIDFALMYLRLKGAGLFYPVLNTPARIDIIEKMGHLEREDAEFMREAAKFYRAVDHGLRVLTGHAEGNLPQSEVLLEALTRLVSRWTPAHLHDQPLRIELEQIQARTREYFERLFRV